MDGKKQIVLIDAAKCDWMPGTPPPVNERPVCAGCGEPMPIVRSIGESAYKYEGFGFFCTIRCAGAYGNRAIRKLLNIR